MADTSQPVDQSERFGQCAPKDATMAERIEAASALLMGDPLTLLEALRDAGLHVIDARQGAVLKEMAAISDEKLRSWISRGFMTVVGLAHAELACRAAKKATG